MPFLVYKEACDQCLLSKDRIVSATRVKEIVKSCHADGNYFICHKATINKEQVCCRTFFDTQKTNIIRVAETLGVVEFIDLPSNKNE